MGMFKMGVAPRMGMNNPNSHFPQLVKYDVNADLAVNATSLPFTLAAGDFPHPFTFVRAEDQIILGPSTDDIYKGNHERRSVATAGVAIAAITADVAIDFAYDSGDPITIIGTNLPAGWVPSTNEASHIEPRGMFLKESAFSDGYLDKYRMEVRWHPANADTLELEQDLGDLLMDSTIYKFGCWYKYDEKAANSPTVSMRVQHEAAAFSLGNFVDNTTDWTQLNLTLTTVTPDRLIIALRSTGGVGVGAGDYSELFANLFYICHAKETDDAATGIYTFDDWPEFGSVQISEVNTTAQARLLDGSVVRYDPLGMAHRRPKFGLSCRFDQVTDNFYQQLRILKSWQDQGNSIVFFHNTDEYLVRGMPPMLVGSFELSGLSQPSWDLGLVSFTFTFNEEL